VFGLVPTTGGTPCNAGGGTLTCMCWIYRPIPCHLLNSSDQSPATFTEQLGPIPCHIPCAAGSSCTVECGSDTVEGSTGTATFTCTNGVFDITGVTECTPSMCDPGWDAIGSGVPGGDAIGSGVPRSDAIGSGVPGGDAIGSRVTELFKAMHLHCSLTAARSHQWHKRPICSSRKH
jgi:hypothetical protein